MIFPVSIECYENSNDKKKNKAVGGDNPKQRFNFFSLLEDFIVNFWFIPETKAQ